MNEKKPVYNGYEEHYATGEELSRLFAGEYLTTGRHHSIALGLSISDYLWFLKIDEQKTYRLFLNRFFCRLMDGDTDRLIAFFGHTVLENVRLSIRPEDIQIHKYCPNCGARMRFREGKYGEFLGCSKYPTCRYTIKIPVLGNDAGNLHQAKEYYKSHTE